MNAITVNCWDLDEGDLRTIYDLETTEIIATVEEFVDHREAIGRLIAAAPEMMVALKHAENALVDYIQTIERNCPMTSLNYGYGVLKNIRAAIAKTETHA